MSGVTAPGSTSSFIARFWLEPGSGGGRHWRGHVCHVQSGREMYFHDLGRLKEFLETIGGAPFPLCAEGKESREVGRDA